MKKHLLFSTLCLLSIVVNLKAQQTWAVTVTKQSITYKVQSGMQVGTTCLGPMLNNLTCKFKITNYQVDDLTKKASFVMTLESVNYSIGSDFFYSYRKDQNATPQTKSVPSNQLNLSGLTFNKNFSITVSNSGAYSDINLTTGSSVQIWGIAKETADAVIADPSGSRFLLTPKPNMGVEWSNLSQFCSQVAGLAETNSSDKQTIQVEKTESKTAKYAEQNTEPISAPSRNNNSSAHQQIDNSGQQRYNQVVETNRNISNASNSASQAITDMTTAMWGTAEERNAKKEQEYQNNLDRIKKQDEAEEAEMQRRNKLNKTQADNQVADWFASEWSIRETVYRNMYSWADIKAAWIAAMKIGTPEALYNFLQVSQKSNAPGYFTYLNGKANEMLLAWEYGKDEPNKYIVTAIISNNWPLTKYLLNAGAQPSFSIKTAFGSYYSAIGQFLAPHYSIETELLYTGIDRDSLLIQMIKQGADANGLYSESMDMGQISGRQYLLEKIMATDVKGTTKWLIENKYVSPQTQQNTFLNMISLGSALWYSSYQSQIEKTLTIYNHSKDSYTAIDNYYMGLATLIHYKNVPLKGMYKRPYVNSQTLNLSISGREDYSSPLESLCKLNHNSSLPIADSRTFIALQFVISYRASEIDRGYFIRLAQECIMSHNNPSCKNLNGQKINLKLVLEKIVELGISPKSKELQGFVSGNGWQSYSMISYAKQFRSEDQDLINWLTELSKGKGTKAMDSDFDATTTVSKNQSNNNTPCPTYTKQWITEWKSAKIQAGKNPIIVKPTVVSNKTNSVVKLNFYHPDNQSFFKAVNISASTNLSPALQHEGSTLYIAGDWGINIEENTKTDCILFVDDVSTIMDDRRVIDVKKLVDLLRK